MFIRFFYDTINIIRRAFYYGKTKETCTSIFIVLHITTVVMIVIKRMNTRKIFFLLRLLYLLLFIFSPTLSLSKYFYF